ncbi:MAG: cytochrome c-type biogenesis protein [Candidatus Longimicrobiales bacterium M2_2A_002]
MIRWLLVGLLALHAGPATGALSPVVAQSTETVPAPAARVDGGDGALERSYVRVARQLRCPVCQQLSILDSPAELAVEMRAVVRERLEAGDSEDEVLAYFVSKYGQWVLLDPPKEGFNLVVWLAPLVLLIGGAAVLAKVFAGWLRSSGSNEGTDGTAALDRPTPG